MVRIRPGEPLFLAITTLILSALLHFAFDFLPLPA